MRFKIIFILIAVLVLAGGVTAYQLFYKSEDNSTSYFQVESGSIKEQVSVTGSLVPFKRIDIKPKTGEEVEEVKVEVSDNVDSGDVLIRLDRTNASLAFEEASANLNSGLKNIELLETQLQNAKNNLENVKQSARENIANAKDQVASAETTLESKEQNLEDVKKTAEIELSHDYEDAVSSLDENYLVAEEAVLTLDNIYDNYFNGTKSMDYTVKSKKETSEVKLSQAKTVIEEAGQTESGEGVMEALTELKQTLVYIKEALAYVRNEAVEAASYRSVVTSAHKTDLNTQKTNIESAIASVVSAKQAVDLQKNTNENNLNAAQAEVNSAQSNLNSAKSHLSYIRSQGDEKISQAESQISQTEKELELKKSQVEASRTKLSKAKQNLEDTVIKAPVDGVITEVDIEEGETADPNKTIVTILPDNNFKIEADVSEVDIGRIEENDKVNVDFDAFPRDVFEGYVSKIHPAEIVKEGVIYYRVEVILDHYPSNLKPGLTANLEIITGQKENVLTVPYVALESRDNQNYVEVVMPSGEIVERRVVLGLEGETEVEIKEGLSQGEKVVTYEK